jgi:membrane-anchored protein YejM (alkaline phosphatase superfamily)
MTKYNHSEKITRRDFLKVLSITPLSLVEWPEIRSKKQVITSANLPNILIIVFDSLSAKHISMHGYHRQTTPNLKRLAEKGTIFHRHYAGGNFTTPGTATLLTGVYPWLHRGLNQHGLIDSAYIQRSIFHLLSDHYHTFT